MNKEQIEKLRNFIPTVPIDLWPIPPSCIQDLLKIAEHSLSAQDEVLTDEKIIDKIDRPGFAWENLNYAEQRNLLGSIRELLSAAAPSPAVAAPPMIRDDWQLVPKEPTPEMIAAFAFKGDVDMAIGHGLIFQEACEDYTEMLLAAPTPPSPSLAVRDIPREPTAKMMEAANRQREVGGDTKDCWRAMWDAAMREQP